MAVATVPTGYLECNGNAVSRTTYAALFAIIGTNYGTGNGSSTFNLPDLRGEFIRGFDNGRGVDSGRSIASSQGSQNAQHNHTATVTDPSHSHSYNSANHPTSSGPEQNQGGSPEDRTSFNVGKTTGTATTGISVSIAPSGGGEARPRSIAMMYIIKV